MYAWLLASVHGGIRACMFPGMLAYIHAVAQTNRHAEKNRRASALAGQARGLYRLLDVDGSGSVDAEEMVRIRCPSAHAGANSVAYQQMTESAYNEYLGQST